MFTETAQSLGPGLGPRASASLALSSASPTVFPESAAGTHRTETRAAEAAPWSRGNLALAHQGARRGDGVALGDTLCAQVPRPVPRAAPVAPAPRPQPGLRARFAALLSDPPHAFSSAPRLPGWSHEVPAQGSPTLPGQKVTGLGYRKATELSRAVLPGRPGSVPSDGEPLASGASRGQSREGEVARELWPSLCPKVTALQTSRNGPGETAGGFALAVSPACP